MSEHTVRYKTNPGITDTIGFYNAYVPSNPDYITLSRDTAGKYYRLPGNRDYQEKDSLFVRETVSVFKPHQLQAFDGKPIRKSEPSSDWIAGLMILCLIVIATIRAVSPRRLDQVFRSAALPYYVNQLEREGNLLTERMSLALGFVYFTSLSLLLYKLAVVFSPGLLRDLNGIVVFVAIFTASLVFYTLKMVAVSLIGNVFKTSKVTHDYLVNNLIFNIVTGILLFPAVILCIYMDRPVYLWVAGSIAVSLLIYRFIRSFMIGLSNTRYSVFYLFLYLCTLEILPLAIAAKFLSKYFFS